MRHLEKTQEKVSVYDSHFGTMSLLKSVHNSTIRSRAIGSDSLPEEVAREIAHDAVLEVRSQSETQAPEGAAPSPEEVRARRVARQRREA